MYGFHLNNKKDENDNIGEKIQKYNKYNCKSIQLFLDNYDKIKDNLLLNNFEIVIHSSFLINICNYDSYYTKKLLEKEIKYCLKNNIKYYILHLGVIMKKMDEKTAIKNMYNMLLYICKKLKLNNKDINICLELLSGSKNDLFYKLNTFSKFYNILQNNSFTKNIKVCLDICHLYASGINFNNSNIITKFIKDVEKYIKWDNVKVIHFNNSYNNLNSRLDKHENINEGKIKKERMKELFKIFMKMGKIIIFELNDIENNLKSLEII